MHIFRILSAVRERRFICRRTVAEASKPIEALGHRRHTEDHSISLRSEKHWESDGPTEYEAQRNEDTIFRAKKPLKRNKTNKVSNRKFKVDEAFRRVVV